MKLKAITVMILASLFSGCSSWSPSVDTTLLGHETVGPAKSSGQIIVYMDASTIGRPYKELALLSAKEGEWDAYYGTGSLAKMIDNLKQEAARIGADAIVIGGTRDKQRPGSTVGSYTNTYGSAVGYGSYSAAETQAIAIIFAH